MFMSIYVFEWSIIIIIIMYMTWLRRWSEATLVIEILLLGLTSDTAKSLNLF